jgi:hypothetical protein
MKYLKSNKQHVTIQGIKESTVNTSHIVKLDITSGVGDWCATVD